LPLLGMLPACKGRLNAAALIALPAATGIFRIGKVGDGSVLM
jgi:hypothetical protein